MSVVVAITRRELFAYLLSPVGYMVIALFLFFTALVYFGAAPLLAGGGFAQGQPASLRPFFETAVWVFFFVAPAITMRAISDELRLGTFETLMTAPVTAGQVVAGKFLGAFVFLALMLVPTVVYVFALERFGRPDYGELLCGYVGLLLVGGALLASGVLASTLTSSQMLAYVTTIFFWVVLLLATMALPVLASLAEGLAGRDGNSAVLDTLLGWLQTSAGFLAEGSPVARSRGFIIGLVDSFNVVYFVSLTAVFLVAATRSLSMRRWL